MKIKKCLVCRKVLYLRKVGGKYQWVHLRYPCSKMESITDCDIVR